MRSISAAVSLLAFGFTTAAAVSSAHAESLSGELEDTMCAWMWAEVEQWTPATGMPAAVIADEFLEHGGSLWMALGYDDSGFWTAEGYSADACDVCDRLMIVRTDAEGKRETFQVVDTALSSSRYNMSESDFRDAIKARIFTVAANDWPVASMQHDYRMTMPGHDDEGRVAKFSGWFAQVSKEASGDDAGFLLRYAQRGISHMCWCDYEWTSYTLASR